MSFVYFRLPHTQQVYRNRLDAEPEELSSLEQLNGRRGFVIAPFAAGDGCPILLVPAEWEPARIDDHCTTEAHLHGDREGAERSRYAADFGRYHAQLDSGRFDKIVLARSSRLHADAHIPPLALFARACRKYPRMFVTLFSTKRSGTWLVATPEILVQGRGGCMHTMALAGTMRLSGAQLGFDVEGSGVGSDAIHWSAKNIQEQHYVETYITECIARHADSLHTEGPYTARAGDLVHLRTDIRFHTGDTAHMGSLLDALHPTPAVCGIPKDDTRRFITRHESAPRGYYSGFAGPLDPDGDTSLFVTLRCMSIDTAATASQGGDAYTLYAGGGLLKDSTCQAEWDETEAKMNTMRQTFKP